MSSLMSLPFEIRRKIWEDLLQIMPEKADLYSRLGRNCNYMYWSEWMQPRKALRLVSKQVKAEVQSLPITIGIRCTISQGVFVFTVKHPDKRIYIRDIEDNFDPDEYLSDMSRFRGYWEDKSQPLEDRDFGIQAILQKYHDKVERALSRFGKVTTISVWTKEPF